MSNAIKFLRKLKSLWLKILTVVSSVTAQLIVCLLWIVIKKSFVSLLRSLKSMKIQTTIITRTLIRTVKSCVKIRNVIAFSLLSLWMMCVRMYACCSDEKRFSSQKTIKHYNYLLIWIVDDYRLDMISTKG